MKVFVKLLLSSLVFAVLSGPAFAKEILLKQQVYGNAAQPAGYVNFCERHASDCKRVAAVRNFEPSKDQLLKLDFIQKSVNSTIASSSDQDLYGTKEYWDYPTDAGDCEDYVLLKKRLLIETGFPEGALRITVVLDTANAGHAVLSVLTKSKDFVLDNMTEKVVVWSELNYTFLSRESTSGVGTNWELLGVVTASTN